MALSRAPGHIAVLVHLQIIQNVAHITLKSVLMKGAFSIFRDSVLKLAVTVLLQSVHINRRGGGGKA